MAPCAWLLGIIPFVYCLSYDAKRNAYKKKGICIQGHIIGTYKVSNRRGAGTYYLKICFWDNGKKIMHTEGYVDNPNFMLSASSCNIYKWRGKYIEADLNTLENEKSHKLEIPIEETDFFDH